MSAWRRGSLVTSSKFSRLVRAFRMSHHVQCSGLIFKTARAEIVTARVVNDRSARPDSSRTSDGHWKDPGPTSTEYDCRLCFTLVRGCRWRCYRDDPGHGSHKTRSSATCAQVKWMSRRIREDFGITIPNNTTGVTTSLGNNGGPSPGYT